MPNELKQILNSQIAMVLPSGSMPDGQTDPASIESILDFAIELTLRTCQFRHLKVDRDELKSLRDECESNLLSAISESSHVSDDTYTPWLDAWKADGGDTFYWDRYKTYLAQSQGWNPHLLSALDREADRILDLSGNPNEMEAWDRRGLAVGDVQSGKTSNYIGLIAKAADAGYKTVIVIAGIQDSLRSQTQDRINEGFLGADISAGKRRVVGVGLLDDSRRPTSYTNSSDDFQREVANVNVPIENSREPVVFVVKKHKSVLENLYRWLKNNGPNRSASRIASPLLLIDDESDNASINNAYNKDEISVINGQIRKILNLFEHRSYVGYTATPFANIFIDPDQDDEMLNDDLFPKSFIYGLETPSNYFGPTEVFGEDSDKYVREFWDEDEFLPSNHKKYFLVEGLSESLKDAVRAYFLCVAIRSLEGRRTEHQSMLVNVSRFIAVQSSVRDELSDYVNVLQNSCSMNCFRSPEDARNDHTIRDLYATWVKEYQDTSDYEWSDIQRALGENCRTIKVVLLNSKSNDRLDYQDHPEGRKLIVVGGQSLSRGLTLEGLVVSYYLRRTAMYDTLLQMGRWFGYRIGYQSLCRIYMPADVKAHFEHVSGSVAELRQDLRRMQQSGLTPRDFGLRVRRHPDMLIVTATNKMGSSEVRDINISLDGKLVDTAVLDRDVGVIDQNWAAVRHLEEAIWSFDEPSPESVYTGTNPLFRRDVPSSIVEQFLREFKNSNRSLLSDPATLIDYIEKNDSWLGPWDVVFFSPGARSESSQYVRLDHVSIRCQRRTDTSRISQSNKKESDFNSYVAVKRHLITTGLDRLGLDLSVITKIKEDHKKMLTPGSSTARGVPDRTYRAARTRPLLVVQAVEWKEGGNDPENDKPMSLSAATAAWSISFPFVPSDLPERLRPQTVSYQVNRVYADSLRQQMEDQTTGDDDEDI